MRKKPTRNKADVEVEEVDYSKLKFLGRGVYAERFKNGYQLRVRQKDGSITTRDVHTAERTITLDPDTAEHFHDSVAVNKALRSLIVQAKKKSAQTQKKLSA